MAESPLKIGFNVPFSEAIKAAQQRKVVLPETYYGELQGLARQQAFSISSLASLDQLTIVRDSLAAKLQSGQTFRQWQKDITESGTLDLPRHRLDNIFRTNIQSNYNRGRWERFVEGKDTRPYLMYDAINDSRVRPSHLAMDGIIRTVDDPFWNTHAPLNGYRCRCRLISLNERMAQARSGNGTGLNKGVDAGKMEPDKGFDYNPGEDLLVGIKQGIESRDGKASPMLLSALNSKITETMKIISLPNFNVVQNKLAELADKNQEWFPKGFNGIHAVSNPELFAALDIQKGMFYISSADDLVSGFSPANDLISAMRKIQSGSELTFNNEYAVETLWHEITHGITGIAPKRYPINIEPLQEGVVQIIARHSYQKLLIALGAKPIFQQEIIASGLAYSNVTSNLLYLFNLSGINPLEIPDIVKNGDTDNQLKELVSERLSISINKAGYLLNQAESKMPSDFKAKIDVQIRNAPRNKGAS